MKRGSLLLVLSVVLAFPAWPQSITTDGNIETDAQLVSNVATGTAPLEVSSTTVVPSLNADQVDGIEGTALALDADLQNAEAMLVTLQAQLDALGFALVPRTGQTTCFDMAGAVTTCSTGIGLAQDGDVQLGVTWPNQRPCRRRLWPVRFLNRGSMAVTKPAGAAESDALRVVLSCPTEHRRYGAVVGKRPVLWRAVRRLLLVLYDLCRRYRSCLDPAHGHRHRRQLPEDRHQPRMAGTCQPAQLRCHSICGAAAEVPAEVPHESCPAKVPHESRKGCGLPHTARLSSDCWLRRYAFETRGNGGSFAHRHSSRQTLPPAGDDPALPVRAL
jgi:hypothetical protein